MGSDPTLTGRPTRGPPVSVRSHVSERWRGVAGYVRCVGIVDEPQSLLPVVLVLMLKPLDTPSNITDTLNPLHHATFALDGS